MEAIMKATEGTPKLLTEALVNSAGKTHEIEGIKIITCDLDVTYEHIRDFLAQKFQVAMMQHPDQDKILKELFASITAKEFK
jgi:hypothetical protein